MYSLVVVSQHAILTRPYTVGLHIEANAALSVRPERHKSVLRVLPECNWFLPAIMPTPPRPPVITVTRRAV